MAGTTRLDIGGLTDLIEKYKIRSYPDTTDTYELIYDFLKDESMKQRKPFFIVDLGQVMKKYEQWCLFLPRVAPYYAVKCNPDSAIITVLGMMGCNFDCASQTEIAIVQDALQLSESDPSRIIFANPIKDEEHIQYARANDVDMTVFDSPDELYKIKLYHTEAQLFLRINIDNPHSIINFGSKFGAKKENVSKLIDICTVLDLNLVGVSFHVGTGCSDSNQYFLALEQCKQVFQLAKSKNVHLSYIDIGGGFPGVDTEDLTFESVANTINDAIDRLFGSDSEFPNVKFLAEPGRFFVASSHTLVVNIIGKKVVYEEDENGGNTKKVFVYHINDGVYGSFNCVLTERTIPSFEPYNERNGNTFVARIFGPTCDSIDSIPGEYMLPELVLGERLYIPNFGAYTTALACDFNGFAKTLSHYIIKFDRGGTVIKEEEESTTKTPSRNNTARDTSGSGHRNSERNNNIKHSNSNNNIHNNNNNNNNNSNSNNNGNLSTPLKTPLDGKNNSIVPSINTAGNAKIGGSSGNASAHTSANSSVNTTPNGSIIVAASPVFDSHLLDVKSELRN